MINTDKKICRDVVALLYAYGVRHVVLCPGTRNAPLVVAVCRHEGLKHTVVVDERSAAFVALGIAVQSQEPVAVICTSGTAVLNLGSALAEARHREVTLIAVTADRPARQLDIDEGQTLHQHNVFANYVKAGVTVTQRPDNQPTRHDIVSINDVLQTAISGRKGPVHINVAIEQPIGTEVDIDVNADAPLKIEALMPSPTFATSQVRRLGLSISSKRVLILCGMLAPERHLNRAIDRLCSIPNIVVMHEAQSNIHAKGTISNIDSVLSAMTPEERTAMLPDVVISVGANPLSQLAKDWLRNAENLEHWYVGIRGYSPDTFGHLTMRIEAPADDFLPQLASAMQPFRNSSNTFASDFKSLQTKALSLDKQFVANAPFSDLVAVKMLVDAMPARYNLHVSNGTTVRYLQLADYAHLHRIDVNRGVSGIDGSTSTAIGAAIAYSGPTALITGDMSAQYDVGALALGCIPKSFRMVVIDNDGGNIFRCIKNTRHLTEVDECLAADVRLPLQELAKGYGFDYYEASSADELQSVAGEFFDAGFRPAILRVVTNPQVSAKVFSDYYKRKYIL